MGRLNSILYLVVFLAGLWGVCAIGALWIPHDPLEMHLTERLLPPNATYFCGTDELGRDIFSRIITGMKTTVSVSLMAFLSSFLIGAVVGGAAGYFYDTFWDRAFNWVSALLFSIPFLLFIAAVMSVTEKNLLNAYLALTAIMWISPARIVRAGIIQGRTAPFVITERAMGRSEASILFRSLIPMSLQPAFIFSFGYFPEIIGMEAGLSFLGLGVQPPHPGLGKMIFDSLGYIYSAWWYAFFPALFLLILVGTANLFYLYLQRKEKEY